MSERYIVRVHLSTRPEKCFWLTSANGEISTDVTLAWEFDDDGSLGLTALVKLLEAEKTRLPDNQKLVMNAKRETLTEAAIPQSVKDLLRTV